MNRTRWLNTDITKKRRQCSLIQITLSATDDMSITLCASNIDLERPTVPVVVAIVFDLSGKTTISYEFLSNILKNTFVAIKCSFVIQTVNKSTCYVNNVAFFFYISIAACK